MQNLATTGRFALICEMKLGASVMGRSDEPKVIVDAANEVATLSKDDSHLSVRYEDDGKVVDLAEFKKIHRLK